MANKILWNLPKLDAADNVFFQRQMEQQLSGMFDKKFAARRMMELVQLDRSIDPTSDRVFYRSNEALGTAARIKDDTDNLPAVNVKKSESFQSLVSYGDSFRFTMDEIRAAAKWGVPLEGDRMAAARKVLMNKLDDILFNGDSDAGLYGLNSVPSANSETAGSKTGGGTAWTASATPDELILDLTNACKKVRTDSLDIEKVTLILLPIDQFEMINNRARSSTSDTTILKFFLDTHPGVRVESYERLDGAGATSSDRMIAYNPGDMDLLRGLLPVEFEMEAPEQRGFHAVVNCRMKTGGVISPFPKTVLYMDSI